MRFTALDGLRGCCALLVALLHFNYFWHFYDSPFVRNSYLFVDFFFVLSGFVISAAYGEKLGVSVTPREFVIRRIGRLWPLHMAVLAAFVLNETAKIAFQHWLPTDKMPFTEDTSPAAIISNIFLVHALGIEHELTWNHPSWSISAELYAYLVFAVATLLCRGREAIAFTLLALSGFSVLFIYSPAYMNASYDFGLFRAVYGFSIGYLTYRLYRRGQKSPPNPWLKIFELFTMLAAIAFVCLCGAEKSSLLAPLVFAPAVYVFAFERGPLAWLLQMRPMQALGTWSYSIYMLHALVFLIMEEVLRRAGFSIYAQIITDKFGYAQKMYALKNIWISDVLIVIYLGMVVAASAFTYRIIEVPCRKAFNRLAVLYAPATQELRQAA